MAGPQSKLCSQGLDPEWITIPLEKFSSAISPLDARAHQWVHDSRRDELFLVFRPERSSCGNGGFEKTTLMIVLAGGDILERQNADKLAAIAEDFKNGVQKGLLDPSLEAPVHVVIKSPCVAVRYPMSLSSVRRIQMKFQTNSDYQRAVNIFRQHHFPMKSAGAKGNSTISDTLLRPASASDIQNSSIYDPYGGSNLLPIAVYQAPKANDLNNTEYGRPRLFSSTESRFFVDPPTASSDAVRPSSAWSTTSARRSEASSLTTVGPSLARPGSALEPYHSSRFERRSHLISTDTSYLAFDSESQTAVPDLMDQDAFHSRSRTADTPEVSLLNAKQSLNAATNSAQSVDTTSFRPAASAYSEPHFSRQDNSLHPDRRTSFFPEFLRPGSAPISESQPHFSQWVPPKRELPFPKVRTTTKFRTPTASATLIAQSTPHINASNSTKTMENITRKDSTSTSTHSAPRVAQRKDMPISATSQALPVAPMAEDCAGNNSRRLSGVKDMEELSPLAAKSAAIARSSSAPGLPSKTASTTSRKRANETLVESTLSSKHIKKMADKATQTKTLSGRDHTAAHSLTLGTQQQFSTTIGETPAQSAPQDFMNEIDAFVSRHKNRPRPHEIWERPGYSEATPEDRQAIINDFICENLDNEDFLKLCEDTAEVWRRIGLEL